MFTRVHDKITAKTQDVNSCVMLCWMLLPECFYEDQGQGLVVSLLFVAFEVTHLPQRKDIHNYEPKKASNAPCNGASVSCTGRDRLRYHRCIHTRESWWHQSNIIIEVNLMLDPRHKSLTLTNG
jgi:hypothetical protein